MIVDVYIYIIWRTLSQSELTPMISNMGLTYLDSEASNYFSYKLNNKNELFKNKYSLNLFFITLGNKYIYLSIKI